MAATLTVKEVAEQLGTDPRTLRKFLRSEVKEAGGQIGEDTPGKGGRYSIESRSVKGLAKRFGAWTEAHTRTTDEEPAEVEQTEAEALSE